jgi:hypothetical protein
MIIKQKRRHRVKLDVLPIGECFKWKRKLYRKVRLVGGGWKVLDVKEGELCDLGGLGMDVFETLVSSVEVVLTIKS